MIQDASPSVESAMDSMAPQDLLIFRLKHGVVGASFSEGSVVWNPCAAKVKSKRFSSSRCNVSRIPTHPATKQSLSLTADT